MKNLGLRFVTRFSCILAGLVAITAGMLVAPTQAFAGGTPIDTVFATANQTTGLQSSAHSQPLSLWTATTRTGHTEILALIGNRWLELIGAGTQTDVPLPLTEAGLQAKVKPTPNPYDHRTLAVRGTQQIRVYIEVITSKGHHHTEVALTPSTVTNVTAKAATGIFEIWYYPNLGSHLNGAAYLFVEFAGHVHWYLIVWISQNEVNSVTGLQPIPWQAPAP